jgi:hypothetical protein
MSCSCEITEFTLFAFGSFRYFVSVPKSCAIFFSKIAQPPCKNYKQKNLEKDLHLTNEKICELNNAIGVSNIRWDKSVCKTKTKKRGRLEAMK